MPLERERKYILNHMPKLPPRHEVHQLLQAYLMIQPDRQLRVRLIDNSKSHPLLQTKDQHYRSKRI